MRLGRRTNNEAAHRQPTPIFERIIWAKLACSHLKPFSRPFSLACGDEIRLINSRLSPRLVRPRAANLVGLEMARDATPPSTGT